MPDLPRQIRLAAGDYFMHGQDRRMRRIGLSGNVCRVAMRLDRGLDVDLLRQRLAASPILDWMTRVRVVRSIPGLPPVWRAQDSPPSFFREHNGNGTATRADLLPDAVLGRDFHSAEGPSIGFDLVRHADGTAEFVLSWNHTVMDARGAELLLRHINASPAIKEPPTVENLINPVQKTRSVARWWNNVKLARGSMKWLRDSGHEPLFSLMPALKPAGPCKNPSRLISFSQEETARIDERCVLANAGFRRSNFYLAASLRSLHALATQRGNKEGAYLVPVPHDMRRRGSNGPIFSNQLSILFYRIEPRQAGRLGDIISELTRQMMDQIRTHFPESCMAALDMFKPIPLDLYVRHLGQPTRGKFATLCFSDSGETCAGMKDLLGAPIKDVTHLVPTWRPPGLTVLFWRFSNRLNCLLSWVDDCMSPSELDMFEGGLRSALLEEVVP